MLSNWEPELYMSQLSWLSQIYTAVTDTWDSWKLVNGYLKTTRFEPSKPLSVPKLKLCMHWFLFLQRNETPKTTWERVAWSQQLKLCQVVNSGVMLTDFYLFFNPSNSSLKQLSNPSSISSLLLTSFLCNSSIYSLFQFS